VRAGRSWSQGAGGEGTRQFDEEGLPALGTQPWRLGHAGLVGSVGIADGSLVGLGV